MVEQVASNHVCHHKTMVKKLRNITLVAVLVARNSKVLTIQVESVAIDLGFSSSVAGKTRLI